MISQPTSTPAQPDLERQRRFMALLEPVHGSLNRFVRAMAHDRDEARDLVSETILIAYERFDTVKDEQAFLAFLFTIAHRTCTRVHRRAKLFGRFGDGVQESIVSRSTPPDVSTDISALHRALNLLPREQCEAVALFELSGFSLEEIREIQGGTLSGVKARVARGRRKLAKLLGVRDRATHDVVRATTPERRDDMRNDEHPLMPFTARGTHG